MLTMARAMIKISVLFSFDMVIAKTNQYLPMAKRRLAFIMLCIKITKEQNTPIDGCPLPSKSRPVQ